MADNPYAPPSAAESPSASGSTAPAPGMAQCSITKKWFPEDELVTFQGQLVSADGKQILLDRLQTGASAPNEFVRPGVWRRFGCIFLDDILFILPSMGLPLLFGIPFAEPVGEPAYIPRRVVTQIILLALILPYFGLLHSWHGQSLGKMVGKLRVINMDGTPISRAKAFARAAAFSLGTILTTLAMILYILLHNPTITSAGILLGTIWVLADYILALADTHMQRSLHDRICGTRVIWLNG